MLSLAQDQYKSGNFEKAPADRRRGAEAHARARSRCAFCPQDRRSSRVSSNAPTRNSPSPATLSQRRRGVLPQRRRLPALAEEAGGVQFYRQAVEKSPTELAYLMAAVGDARLDGPIGRSAARCCRRRSSTSSTAAASATRLPGCSSQGPVPRSRRPVPPGDDPDARRDLLPRRPGHGRSTTPSSTRTRPTLWAV